MTVQFLTLAPQQGSDRVERVVKMFGGYRAMARILGHKNVTTVHGWKRRGIIPSRQHQAIWSAAKAQGISLRPADLLMVSA